MFIDQILIYIDIELNLSSHLAFQAFWIEISFIFKKNGIFGVDLQTTQFQSYFEETIEKLTSSGKCNSSHIMGYYYDFLIVSL